MFAQNPEIQRNIQPHYSSQGIERIRDLLMERGALSFPALPSGLFSAALVSRSAPHTGYQATWVRDNVQVAHSLMVNGESAKAVKAVLALAEHFERQTKRFEAIIADPSIAANPMNRPHVKFNGFPIGEIPNWSHAQNDALGYFLWIFTRMVRLGYIPFSQVHASLMARFASYFQAIRFWLDEDSGHWEEERRNSASSIGTVCAGLRELNALLESAPGVTFGRPALNELVESLLRSGLDRLNSILPSECVQVPPRRRRYDAALLFLAYPLEIVSDEMADQIIEDIQQNLQGDYGIRRYLGDSFWCLNYRRNLSAEDRTRHFQTDLRTRDRFFEPGTEAQWCIFDPIISVAFGRRYQRSGDAKWLVRQTEYFNRALRQITPDFLCPELWHWETADDGSRILETSEATPLLWTQSNLRLALKEMEKSAKRI
jgi:phosphorylase kinase alpha/beta subunit